MEINFMDVLQKIASKDIPALTKSDKDFLKARKSYLTEEQLEKFDKILNPKKPKK